MWKKTIYANAGNAQHMRKSRGKGWVEEMRVQRENQQGGEIPDFFPNFFLFPALRVVPLHPVASERPPQQATDQQSKLTVPN